MFKLSAFSLFYEVNLSSANSKEFDGLFFFQQTVLYFKMVNFYPRVIYNVEKFSSRCKFITFKTNSFLITFERSSTIFCLCYGQKQISQKKFPSAAMHPKVLFKEKSTCKQRGDSLLRCPDFARGKTVQMTKSSRSP